MSLLTPLYLLGALAVVAPIVFHLIRQTTRGQVPFSSLLFLQPTPPKLTRRSRLDHWPLLLLRAAALVLLAAAFARPFLREVSALNLGRGERSRVVVLLDQSASLRRGTLWRDAQAAATAAIDALEPDDQVAILGFDTTTRPVLSFAASAQLDPAQRGNAARAQVAALTPTWSGTDIGQALIDAVGTIEDVGDDARRAARTRRRVVLVSDLAAGSKLDALGDFEWPKDVELELRPVRAAGSNAGLQAQATSDAPTPGGDLAVRISNDAGSKRDTFTVEAESGGGAASPPIYVPPGESRVARLPRPSTPGALRLRGDDFAFDNTLYVTPDAAEPATVLFVGSDRPDDPAGLVFYLTRALGENPARPVRVVSQPPSAPLTKPLDRSLALIVLSGDAGEPSNNRFLEQFVRDGGTLLTVLTPGPLGSQFDREGSPAPPQVVEAPGRGDALLQDIAFDHPLFAPFAAPPFNDFTKVHFWKHRLPPPEALGPDCRILARFEGGDPAVIERPFGAGRLLMLTSGWSPADSQLARSTKFAPMMAALVDWASGAGTEIGGDLHVGDPIPLAPDVRSVRKPDGSDAMITNPPNRFAATDGPGLYTLESPGRPARRVAVNLDPAESRTTPLAAETLEQFGVRLASPTREAAEREAQRQMQNAELEGRQKVWRWLILAAVAVLLVETALAGWLGRPRPVSLNTSSDAEAPAP